MQLSSDGTDVLMTSCSGSDNQVWIWKRSKQLDSDNVPGENDTAADDNVAVNRRKSSKEQHRAAQFARKSQMDQEIAGNDY